MFNKILLVYSEKESKNKKNILKIKRILGEKIKKIVCVRNLQFNVFNNIDLVITLGGDGTFIRAASFIKKTPILGINSESKNSEGALTSLNEFQINKIPKLLEDPNIIKRKRIQIEKNNVKLDKLALNEIFIGSQNQFHTSRYEVKFNNKKEEQRSSGILIATGSGSSAWYKSAGGKIFNYNSRDLHFIVREPYKGKIFNPKILKGKIKPKQNFEIKSKMHHNGVIALDSNTIYEFRFGDKCKASISDKDLNVLTLKNENKKEI